MSATKIPYRYWYSNLLFLPSDVSTSSTSFTDVTSFGFSVVSGKTYKFRWYMDYDPSSTAVGPLFALNGPTYTRLNAIIEWTRNTTLSYVACVTGYNATASVGATTNQTSISSSNICTIDGMITPSANGTLIPRFCADSGGGTFTINEGHSYLEWTLMK